MTLAVDQESATEMAESRRVLLVEDDPVDTKWLQQMLDAEGCETISVSSLQAAAQQIALKSIDLVLLDLALPDSYPASTFDEIERIASHVPIIIVSGNSLTMKLVNDRSKELIAMFDKNDLDKIEFRHMVRAALRRGNRGRG